MGRAEDGEALELRNSQLQHIARISGGKDGLKMLDVIVTRGLPLDRITTTDVWATDTIRGEHPKMVAFKDQVDEYIWRKYRIEVEHLCATRNGEKLTYEKLFYHVPKRKTKNCRGGGCSTTVYTWLSDAVGSLVPVGPQTGCENSRPQGFPIQKGSWCKKLKMGYIRLPRVCYKKGRMVPEAQNQVFRWPHPEGR